MAIAVSILALIAIVLGVLASTYRRGIRVAARLGLGVFFVISLAVTGALIYGSVVLEKSGGGVLILFALPAGIVTWIAGTGFFASVRVERYYQLPVEEKIRTNVADLDAAIAKLEASVAAKMAKRGRFGISATRRAELDREIEHEQEMLRQLPRLREPLQRPQTYERDER